MKEHSTWKEFIVEGLKKCIGDIIGIMLLTILVLAFPSVRNLFTSYEKLIKDEEAQELQHSTDTQRKEEERLKEALKKAEEQRQAEAKRREEIEAELQRKEEALRQAQAQKPTGAQQQKPEQRKTNRQRPAMSDKDFIELCKYGKAQAVEEAIIDGANVNAKDNLGRTALMWASRNGHTGIANLLRKYGAK